MSESNCYPPRANSASRSQDRDVRECDGCRQPFQLKYLLRAPCNHMYCRDCVKDIFYDVPFDGPFPPQCQKPHKITPESMSEFLTRDLISRLRPELEEYGFETRGRMYCASCSCYISPDKIEMWSEGKLVGCANCGLFTCKLCHEIGHPGPCQDEIRDEWKRERSCEYEQGHRRQDRYGEERGYREMSVGSRGRWDNGSVNSYVEQGPHRSHQDEEYQTTRRHDDRDRPSFERSRERPPLPHRGHSRGPLYDNHSAHYHSDETRNPLKRQHSSSPATGYPQSRNNTTPSIPSTRSFTPSQTYNSYNPDPNLVPMSSQEPKYEYKFEEDLDPKRELGQRLTECLHPTVDRPQGRAQCEVCGVVMHHYILQCETCEMKFCGNCHLRKHAEAKEVAANLQIKGRGKRRRAGR